MPQEVSVKIAFVTPEYITESNFSGGLANYLSRVTHALRKLGHDPFVIVAAEKDGFLEDDGVPVFRVRVQAPWQSILESIPVARRVNPVLRWLWQSWKLNRKLSEIHAAEKIDIVQYASYTATALFRIKSIPSVVRLSGIQNLIDQGYEQKRSLNSSILHYLDITSMRNADCIIGPSRLISQKAQKAIGKPVTVIESPYLPSCVPYDRQPYDDLLSSKEYLLFFGSIGVLKGVKTIARGIHPLLSKHHDLFMVFAGKDMGFAGSSMIQHVWECAGSHRGRVLYLGTMHRDQLFPIIEGAKAVVLPSLVDNLPNTCIEAMANGKVVIGTLGASFEQLIDDGENGFLCTINDEHSLMDSIDKALNLSDEERQAIGRKAQKTIERLNPEHVVKELLNIYCEVIQAVHNPTA
jgi:glycogen synthase